MNWSQFKYPVSNTSLAGAEVASQSLTQEAAGSNPFTEMTNFLSLNSVKTFREYSVILGTKDRPTDLTNTGFPVSLVM